MVSKTWQCVNCQSHNAARQKTCEICGIQRIEPTVRGPRGADAELSQCRWQSPSGQPCLLPNDWSPSITGGRGYCSWHAQFKGLAGAGVSGRAVDDFTEFCQWWEVWHGVTAQIAYCGYWSHHLPGELWALCHGERVTLSLPTACRVSSCPHRVFPPWTGTPNEAMGEIRRVLGMVVDKIALPAAVGKHLP